MHVPTVRKRRRAVPAIIIAASILAFLGVFAVWVNRQALNTDNWTDTSSKLLENDAIRTQVAAFLVDQLYANVDVEGQVRAALPPRAAPLAGAASGALREFAQRAAFQLLDRPRPQRLWEEANRRAHERLLDVVEGGGSTLSTAGGEVTLDLRSLLGQTEDRVGVGGKLQQKVPPDAAQITIMRSDQLELAQDVVNAIRNLAIVLVVLALGLFALAVYLAVGWRREALRACGIGFVAAGAAVLIVRSLAGDVVADQLTSTESVRPTADAAWSIGTSLLRDAAVALIAYGLVIVAAAWLAGGTRLATGTRRSLAPYLKEPAIAFGAAALLLLLLVLWAPTPAWHRFVPVLIFVVLVLLGVEVLRRQTAREFPEASREEAARRRRERLAAWRASWRRRPASSEIPSEAAGDGARLEQLERLARLKESGVLDGAEFEREKQRLLEGAARA
jgi:hypothetical protein